MKRIWYLSLLTGTNILYLLLASMSSRGQITPDGTLPTNINESSNVTEITGGTEVGNNLFHSFQGFSVPTGSEAFFNNADNISNIINRVTGGSISDINGLIRANGSANLFLLNPAGIVFGPNASLNIGGSFLGSTADSLVFPDNIEFSATGNLAKPLLTINAPIGLRFRDNPGTIVNNSLANPGATKNIFDTPTATGLQVAANKTLAFVGGNLKLEGGNLTSPGGNIELGSVAGNSLVNINPTDRGWTFGYENVKNFQDIQLADAIVGTRGIGGTINVQGNKVTLINASQIFSVNSGEQTGGQLTINAAESIDLSGTRAFPGIVTSTESIGDAGNLNINTKNLSLFDGAGIVSIAGQNGGSSGEIKVKASNSIRVIGATASNDRSQIASRVERGYKGNGNNVTIDTKRLFVTDGGQISSSTSGQGNAGNLTVNASDIEINGTGTLLGRLSTTANPSATGDAGNLTINTERLTALNGGFVSSVTVGPGKAGNITLNAPDFVTLSGTRPNANLVQGSSGIFVSAESNSTGNGGNLTLTTKELTVEKGAKISADTLSTGKAGNATLNVDRLIVRDGGQIRSGSLLGNNPVSSDRGVGGNLTINATDSVQVIGTGTIGTSPVISSLFTQAQGTGNAGNLNIFTPNLTVRDGAEINVSAFGLGQAGNLEIKSNNTQLDKGIITAATANGEGGNISLQANDLLLLRNSSKISAQATGEASGGNINIDARFVVANPNQNNDIIANAQRGRGGNISIATDGIFGLQQGKATPDNQTNDIDASSDFGFNGNISITTPDVNPAKERVQSPESVVEPEEMTAQACRPNEVADKIENNTESTFTISGRGGMPPSPTEPLIKDVIRVGGELSKPRSNSENVIKTAQALLEGKKTIDFDRHTKKQESKLVAIETNQTKKIHSEDIVPARGMMINEKGQIVLTAYPTSINGDRLPVNSFNCQS